MLAEADTYEVQTVYRVMRNGFMEVKDTQLFTNEQDAKNLAEVLNKAAKRAYAQGKDAGRSEAIDAAKKVASAE